MPEQQRRHRFGWRTLTLLHDGRAFLRRDGFDTWRLFGIVVHRLDGPDPGIDLHDHPWPFVSIVVRGGYVEQHADARVASQLAWQAEAAEFANTTPVPDARGWVREWRRWSIHRMPLTVAHRIIATQPGTVTVMIRGRKQRRWGFFQPEGWTDHATYDYATRRPVTAVSSRPDEVLP